MLSILWTFLVCGAIPTGGKPLALMLPEMTERRKWLTPRDFSEAIAFGYALPGPVLISMVVYLAPLIPRRISIAACLTTFLLPGVAILVAMAAFMLDSGRPYWVDGAISGLGPAAVGMLVSSAWPVFGTARDARLGLVTAALAFLGVGILRLDRALVLLPLLLVSLAANRPGKSAP
jgi:chromate transporter